MKVETLSDYAQQRWARIRTGWDWIRTDANLGRIRTGSDWEIFCFFNV